MSLFGLAKNVFANHMTSLAFSVLIVSKINEQTANSNTYVACPLTRHSRSEVDAKREHHRRRAVVGPQREMFSGSYEIRAISDWLTETSGV